MRDGVDIVGPMMSRVCLSALCPMPLERMVSVASDHSRH